MAQCQWREKPGDLPLCHTMLQADSEFCPRHHLMHKARAEKQRDRELERLLKRKAPAKVVTNTRRGLIEAGHQFVGNRRCVGCDKPIELWRNPNGNNAPWDPMPDEGSYARSHFATCTNAAKFRQQRSHA